VQAEISEIAAALHCDPNTLRNNAEFMLFFEENKERGKLRLRHSMFKAALKGDRTMRIWLSKQYLGMQERHELAGKDGGPIQFKVVWEDKSAVSTRN